MAEQLAEKTKALRYQELNITSKSECPIDKISSADVIFISLPQENHQFNVGRLIDFLQTIIDSIKENAKIIFFAENDILPLLCYGIESYKLLNYKIWISVRKQITNKENALPNETKGAVIFSKSSGPLHICKVRLPYTYCPACNKTTKDYGGKKHLFHEYGTLMSDVWKDFRVVDDDPLPKDVTTRIREMFSIDENESMLSISLWDYEWEKYEEKPIAFPELNDPKPRKSNSNSIRKGLDRGILIHDDALEVLRGMESNSVDYIFVDPPYNLKKKYKGYKDDLEIEEYFSWCDQWLEECYRVLKPGRFLSILNLPLWCVRHYAYLIQKMNFSSWITWEALSRPARNIMPAHYSILTMQKPIGENDDPFIIQLKDVELPLEDYYCLRPSCIKKREPVYKPLTDLWTDIHRLKHNSRRLDHPCQLPPNLMKRLISIYTKSDDVVLDCFNGIGTTTLVAELLGRRFIGVELIEKYHRIAQERHQEISLGLDPFRKNQISADKKTKNNEEKRMKSIKSENGLSKRKIQLMIKELSQQLGKIPTLDDAMHHLDIPKELYDEYFKSWSEIVQAAKTTGMSEYKKVHNQ